MNTYMSSMRSRVSYRFQIDSSSKKRCENATSGREFFLKTEKKVGFSNEYGYLWTGPYSVVIIDQQNSKGGF